MHIQAKGNQKLGEKTIAISRPVDDTCPDSCPFLHNGCYAEKTEKQHKLVRPASFRNLTVSVDEFEESLIFCLRNNKAYRLMERGDWLRTNSQGKKVLDRAFVRAFVLACERVLKKEGFLPKIWNYTHVYDAYLVKMLSPHVYLYASVHNSEDVQKAKDAGFTLFAYITELKKPHWAAKVKQEIPKFVSLPVVSDKQVLVCPEQRKGRKSVRCDKCKHCFSGSENHVAFINH